MKIPNLFSDLKASHLLINYGPLKLGALNPLSAKFIKWSNTLKQFVGKLPINCLSMFDHFVGLALKGLRITLFHKEYAGHILLAVAPLQNKLFRQILAPRKIDV